MKNIAILGVGLFMATTAANAAVPNPVVALLGPSVGYMLSQSELCHWDIADKIRKTYEEAFKTIGMTPAQQATAWEQAAATQKRMSTIPANAKARMKADTCTAAMRTKAEHDLTE